MSHSIIVAVATMTILIAYLHAVWMTESGQAAQRFRRNSTSHWYLLGSEKLILEIDERAQESQPLKSHLSNFIVRLSQAISAWLFFAPSRICPLADPCTD